MHTAATYDTVWEGSTFVLHLIQKSQTGLQLAIATAQSQKPCHVDDWASNTPPTPHPLTHLRIYKPTPTPLVESSNAK